MREEVEDSYGIGSNTGEHLDIRSGRRVTKGTRKKKNDESKSLVL